MTTQAPPVQAALQHEVLPPQRELLPDTETLKNMLAVAAHLAKSGMLPSGITSSDAAFAIILKARELGLPPMAGFAGIAIIKGKPTCNAELLLALIYRDHGDGAVVFTESTDECAALVYRRRGWPAPREFRFTRTEAQRAGLLGNATWDRYPAAMLRARAISAVARMAFPDSIGGMHLASEVRDGDTEGDADGGGEDMETPPAPRAIHAASIVATAPTKGNSTTARTVDTATGEVLDRDGQIRLWKRIDRAQQALLALDPEAHIKPHPTTDAERAQYWREAPAYLTELEDAAARLTQAAAPVENGTVEDDEGSPI